MNCSAPFPLQRSPLVRGAGVLAALLASSGAIGAIDAMALHYSRQQQVSSLARTGDPLRCGVPRATAATRAAS